MLLAHKVGTLVRENSWVKRRLQAKTVKRRGKRNQRRLWRSRGLGFKEVKSSPLYIADTAGAAMGFYFLRDLLFFWLDLPGFGLGGGVSSTGASILLRPLVDGSYSAGGFASRDFFRVEPLKGMSAILEVPSLEWSSMAIVSSPALIISSRLELRRSWLSCLAPIVNWRTTL